jgi:hypothetical protein
MSWLESKPADAIGPAMQLLADSEDPRAVAVRDYCGGDLRFGLWLYLVDKRCRTVFGLSVFDLEDFGWRDAYDDGSSPKAALHEFCEEHDVFRPDAD